MKRIVPLMLFILLFFGGFAVASVVEYFDTLKQRDAILNGETIEIELNKTSMSGSNNYSVGYEFYDENNVYYWGTYKSFTYREEAHSYLGKKIEIHIDGRGNSIPVGQKATITFALVFAIIMPTIFGLMIIALIICYYKYRKWCKKMEPIWAAKRKETELNGNSNE